MAFTNRRMAGDTAGQLNERGNPIATNSDVYAPNVCAAHQSFQVDLQVEVTAGAPTWKLQATADNPLRMGFSPATATWQDVPGATGNAAASVALTAPKRGFRVVATGGTVTARFTQQG